MTRRDVIEILDGHHGQVGRRVAFVLHALILLSALAISLETVESFPPAIHNALFYFEIFILTVFVTEYILRVICSARPLRYIFSFWGIIDLLACLPALLLIQEEWQAIRTLRLIRLVRLFKLFRTSLAFDRLTRAFAQVRGELIIFAILASLVLYVSAVGIYLFEHETQPDAFSSIPMSLWWAVASLTTVGYGDLVPITTGGRIFTTFVLFIGLGVVAVPAAIVTAALLETQTAPKRVKKKKKKKHTDSASDTQQGD